MNKKILATFVFVVLAVSIVSAGLFEWNNNVQQSPSGVAATLDDPAYYNCLVDEKATRSSIPCTAHFADNCMGFDDQELIQVLTTGLAQDGAKVIFKESEKIMKFEWFVLPDDSKGFLMDVATITNSSSGFSSDVVTVKDLLTGDVYDAAITSEGKGVITIGGHTYTVNYFGASSSDEKYITIDFPETASSSKKLDLEICF